MANKLGSLESSEQLILELYIDLRRKVGAWAKITKQTAQARMGYIGQHLVSVVTGSPGGRSGARGKDLVLPDGQFAEIKTCYRVDQLGKCENCGAAVASIEMECSSCKSPNIKRNDDSKWLIGIQHEEEFAEILDPSFYFLVLFDFTDLKKPDTIRASIWRVDPLIPGFAYCVIDYYKNIKAKSKSGAPLNLWPFQLKFELMRPILIYQSFIKADDSIETQLFPGRDEPVQHPFPHLPTFSRSSNLTANKIEAFAEALGLELPKTDKKAILLAAAAEQIEALPPRLVIDTIAKALYWPDIEPHIKELPGSLHKKLTEAKLI